MSYLIPTEELTLSDIKAFRGGAAEAGIAMAIKHSIGARDGLVVRAAENIADFTTTLDQWNTAALNVVGTNYTVFNGAANPTLAVNKVAVFYKVGIETAPNPVGLLSFRRGAAAGTTLAVFDTEQLVNKLTSDGYFSEPVVYGPQTVLNVVVMARIATLLLARVQLGCFIIEPVQQTIS